MSAINRLAMVIGCAVAAGCTGAIGDTLPNVDDPSFDEASDEPDFDSGTLHPGEQTLLAIPRYIRLTHTQWENTMTELFHLATPTGLSRNFASDGTFGSFDNDYRRLEIGAQLWSNYQSAAEQIAEQQVWADDRDRWYPTDDDAEAFIRDFGRRAFRRPLEADEVDDYLAIFAAGPDNYGSGDDFADGVQMVLEAMLQSPYLLYRAETSDQIENASIRLSGFEVASRMSFLLWNSMPDDELLHAAEAGVLDDEAGIIEHFDRMFDDERAHQMLERYHDQAYGLSKFTDLAKQPLYWPDWDRDRYGRAYLTEARMFLENLAFSGGTARDFLLSRRSYVNADLANVYGLTGNYGDDFVAVELPENRPGFVTRQGLLATKAKIDSTDLIHRGLFVATTLLCRTLAPPPNNATANGQVGTTMRKRIESITGPGTCGAGCHATVINPPGYSLEGFDAIGAVQTEDAGEPVDTASDYTLSDGTQISFDSYTDLAAVIADTPQYHRCFASHMVEYTYGRGVMAGDMPFIDTLAERTMIGNGDIRSTLRDIVVSRGFRYRAVTELEDTL